jgi:hypothetical protein
MRPRTSIWLSALIGTLVTAAVAPAQDAAEQFAAVFPRAEMEDVSTLKLERVGERVVDSQVVPGTRLRAIDVRFTSFTWAGEEWRHDAVVLLPAAGVPERARGAGTVVAGIPKYADASAAVLGIPSLLVTSGNPGPHYGEPNEGELMGWSLAREAATGDPHWNGYAWLGKVLVRGVTVLAALPETGVERAVVSGCSKRGMAAWIAAAADRRVVGAYPTCWNTGNYRATAKQLLDRFGEDYQQGRSGTKAPAFVSAREQYERTLVPGFEKLTALTDPVLFKGLIANKAILYAAGANDPLYHVLASNLVVPELEGEKLMMLVPNAGHTPNTEQHLTAWTMWAAHVLLGRPVPAIQVNVVDDGDRITVRAEVGSATAISDVALWSAEDPAGGYHDSRWTSTPMTAVDGEYRAQLPRPAAADEALFVAVRDSDPATCPGYLTSRAFEVRAPAPPQE